MGDMQSVSEESDFGQKNQRKRNGSSISTVNGHKLRRSGNGDGKSRNAPRILFL